jgi:hypothetical protein
MHILASGPELQVVRFWYVILGDNWKKRGGSLTVLKLKLVYCLALWSIWPDSKFIMTQKHPTSLMLQHGITVQYVKQLLNVAYLYGQCPWHFQGCCRSSGRCLPLWCSGPGRWPLTPPGGPGLGMSRELSLTRTPHTTQGVTPHDQGGFHYADLLQKV